VYGSSAARFFFASKMLQIVLYIIWAILTIWIITPVAHHHYYVVMPVIPDEAEQNSHDTSVRSVIANKYAELVRITNIFMREKSISLPALENYLVAELSQLQIPATAPLLQKLAENETIIISEGLVVREREILARIWLAFKINRLDISMLHAQISDTLEDGEIVCVNGRVARYFSAFTGLLNGPLGEPEITEKMLFEEALAATKKKLHSALAEAGLEKVFNGDSHSNDAEVRLKTFLENFRRELGPVLEREYPHLPKHRVDELIQAF